MSRLPTNDRARHRQSGLTLIELMISLLISSIMIGLVFSIYTRMSVAYRSQSSVSELQQTLQAAKMQITSHVIEAGHLIPDGFMLRTTPSGSEELAVQVVNDAAAGDPTFHSDVLKVYYADVSAMARVVSASAPFTSITVDSLDRFGEGDVVVIVNPNGFTGGSPGVAAIAKYNTCVVRISGMTASPATLYFSEGAYPAYNSATNSHCTDALDIDPTDNRPMVYRFVARAYRIDPDPDPAQRRRGVLQMSRSGGILDDWEDIGLGFTNLQLAVRYYEGGDVTDVDGDGDPLRDWYSGSVAPPLDAVPMEVSLSLEARTPHQVNGAPPTDRKKFFIGSKPLGYNRVGDDNHDYDPTPVRYQGDHLYRWFTTYIDLRNLGVGR